SYVKTISESNEGSTLKVGVAVNPDNKTYFENPFACAILNVENKDNYSWFVELIGDNIELPTDNVLTLMLDQHKGLNVAAKDIMPHAEHMQSARHIDEGSESIIVEFNLEQANKNIVRDYESYYDGVDEYNEEDTGIDR
nr:hypothetical protein [Tanacetum cinerariifolium]